MKQLPENLTKLYYSIGEVADMLDINHSVIRYWEGEFSALKPRKNRKGDRQFTVADIEIVVKIYNLVKIRGFTIDGANKELKNMAALAKKIAPIEKKLLQIRKSLLRLRDKTN